MEHYSLEQLIGDHQKYHSSYQIDHFIIGRAGGTAYARYKQALRELSSRVAQLRIQYIDLELERCALEEIEITPCDSMLALRRRDLEAAKKRLEIEGQERAIQDAEREAMRFWKIGIALKNQVGELTEEARAEHERELWRDKLATDFALARQTKGVSSSLLETLAAIPEEDAAAILQGDRATARNIDELIRALRPGRSLEVALGEAERMALPGTIEEEVRQCRSPLPAA